MRAGSCPKLPVLFRRAATHESDRVVAVLDKALAKLAKELVAS